MLSNRKAVKVSDMGFEKQVKQRELQDLAAAKLK
jgi:hypothetical protein